MTRARPTRGTDSITLAKPNTTSVHIQRPKPAPLRKAGLQIPNPESPITQQQRTKPGGLHPQACLELVR